MKKADEIINGEIDFCLFRWKDTQKLISEFVFLGYTLSLEWEEGRSVVPQLLQVWLSKLHGPKHSLMSPEGTRHGLYPSILVLALLPGQGGAGPFRPRFRIQNAPCWPAGMAKSNEHQIYTRNGGQFKLSAIVLLILIFFILCHLDKIALKKCSSLDWF